MEYLAHEFPNTADGLKQKEECTKQLAAQGYRILKETRVQLQLQDGKQRHRPSSMPSILLDKRTPSKTVVTYGRDDLFCASCGSAVSLTDAVCRVCKAELSEATTLTDRTLAQRIAAGRQEAARRTAEINQRIDQLSSILVNSLTQHHHFHWSSLKEPFTVPEPIAPVVEQLPRKSAFLYLIEIFPFIEALLPPLRERRLAWEEHIQEIEQRNQETSAQYKREFEEWTKLRNSFEKEQTAQVEANTRLYQAKHPKTVIRYCGIILERSQYPPDFPRSQILDYSADEQRLTIDFELPPISILPHVGEVKYNRLRGTFDEIRVSDIWLKETYEDLVVQVVLRTLHELFESDVIGALSTVLFRGHTQTIDKSGREKPDPIALSVEASKTEFVQINLAQVDALACFKRMKGVLSEHLVHGAPLEFDGR